MCKDEAMVSIFDTMTPDRYDVRYRIMVGKLKLTFATPISM